MGVVDTGYCYGGQKVGHNTSNPERDFGHVLGVFYSVNKESDWSVIVRIMSEYT